MNKEIFNHLEVEVAIQSMVDWIWIHHKENILNSSFLLIGIETGGTLVQREIVKKLHQNIISENLNTHSPIEIIEGSVNITMYRDDLYTGLEKPILGVSHLPVSITNKSIVLLDDVLFTGRTIRAALQELLDYGRPKKVDLLVLLDRGGRELPIQPNFSALCYNADPYTKIQVQLESGSTPSRNNPFSICIDSRA